MTVTMTAVPLREARIFLSWSHKDKALKDVLLQDLEPALGLMAGVRLQWWADSHVTCGEKLGSEIDAAIDESDYGLLLLSNAYFASPFIRANELPRFVTDPGAPMPPADKKCLPVYLKALPGFGSAWRLAGVPNHLVHTAENHRGESRSFQQLRGEKRTEFANDLADSIRRRILDLSKWRTLGVDHG